MTSISALPIENVGLVQVTVVTPAAPTEVPQVHPVPVAFTCVKPAGTVWVTTAPEADEGPALVTVTA